MDSDQMETWKRALVKFRKDKDDYFKQDHEAPLPDSDRESFSGLKYFDPDPNFVFGRRLSRYKEPEGIMMTTSKGARQLFNRVGYFEVEIAGQQVKLQAYQSAQRIDPNIFIPFRDGTSGKESYGAARYLDLEVEHDDEYLVDFNYAYNPYCAYSDDYVCPLPPQENWLKIRVPAGEMKYHD